jgi:hypothetical protein
MWDIVNSALRNFDDATIRIAEVVLRVLLTALIRFFMSLNVAICLVEN